MRYFVSPAIARGRPIHEVASSGDKTIGWDFRKDNGRTICQVCTRFVVLGRRRGLLAQASAEAFYTAKTLNRPRPNAARLERGSMQRMAFI